MVNKIDQLNTIKKGLGLQQFLDAASNILGNPMLIFDMDYRLVAYTDAKVDDPIWNEFVENGALSYQTVEFSMSESFIDIAANNDGHAYLLVSEKLKYNRIIGQIYNKKNEPVADLAVVACAKPFDDGDQPMIEAICEKITAEIGNDKYYLEYGKAYYEKMIIRLIENDFEDRRLYADHIANIYRGFKKNIYVAVARSSKANSTDRLAYLKDVMRQRQPNFKYAIYRNHIVILFSSNYKTFRTKRALNKLYTIFEQENMHVEISSHFDSLFDLPEYFAEAFNALNGRTASAQMRGI